MFAQEDERPINPGIGTASRIIKRARNNAYSNFVSNSGNGKAKSFEELLELEMRQETIRSRTKITINSSQLPSTSSRSKISQQNLAASAIGSNHPAQYVIENAQFVCS